MVQLGFVDRFESFERVHLELVLVSLLVGVGVGHEVDVADGLAEHRVPVRDLVPAQQSFDIMLLIQLYYIFQDMHENLN